jgi:hypothetical protein
MEELKKSLVKPQEEPPPKKERKVKKIIYEDDEVEEEVVPKRKAFKPVPDAPLEGRALLDHLFFGKK